MLTDVLTGDHRAPLKSPMYPYAIEALSGVLLISPGVFVVGFAILSKRRVVFSPVLIVQVKILFPKMSPWRRNRLRFDEESLWSITDQNTADEVRLHGQSFVLCCRA